MPKYVIERTIPGAGTMTDEEWRGAAAQSNEALDAISDQITWLHSYVMADKLHCVYDAANAEIIREHGRRGGFPVDSVAEVARVIDPSTAAAAATSR